MNLSFFQMKIKTISLLNMFQHDNILNILSSGIVSIPIEISDEIIYRISKIGVVRGKKINFLEVKNN